MKIVHWLIVSAIALAIGFGLLDSGSEVVGLIIMSLGFASTWACIMILSTRAMAEACTNWRPRILSLIEESEKELGG